MSLLQKASIITTPTAYAEDYLYSIKPAYALGVEQVTNGNFSDGTNNWAGNSDTTLSVTNKQLDIQSGDGNYGVAYAVVNFIAGKKYQIKLDVISCNVPTQIRVGTSNSISSGSHSNIYNSGDIGVGSHTKFYTATATETYLAIGGRDDVDTLVVDNVSVKEVTDADFDFDRNSTGTRVNEDYLIEDVPYNLVLQSNQFDTTWTLFQGGTVTGGQPDKDYGNNAWRLNAVSTQSFSGLYQNKTFTGVTTLSIFAKAGTLSHLGIVNLNGTGFAVWFNLSNGTIGTKDASVSNANMQNLGDGWYRCSFTQDVSAAGYFQLKPSDGELTPSTTSGFVYIQDAQLVKGDQPKDYLKTTDRLDIPRIDYTNGEPSILLEPSRTNLETKSNEFSTWGVISNTTRTANYTQSPEGLNNATRLQFTANGYVANTPQILGTYTISCYAKRNDSGTQNVGFFTNGSGVVNSAWAVTSEWKRFSYTFPTLNGSYMGIAGVSGADISVYGFQIEGLVSYATSYIPTSGSTVTRSADAANNAGNSDLINSTEGVLYAEMKALADDNTDRRIAISDGTMNNYVSTGYSRFTGNIVAEIISNGVLQTTDWGATGVTQTDNIKFALSWSSSIMKFYMNGVQKQTTSMNSPTGMNNLRFSDAIGNAPMYTNVKSIMVFKEALTDLELEKLTGYNNHELYMNYYNRLSYLGLAEEYNVESDINNYIL